MGLDPKKLHMCFISVSFDKASLSSPSPLAGEIKTNLGLSKSAIALDNSYLQSPKYPIWKALQKLYKGYMGLDPKKLHICIISAYFIKASSFPPCVLLPDFKTNLGLSKSAIALDNSYLQSAKYTIWKAL